MWAPLATVAALVILTALIHGCGLALLWRVHGTALRGLPGPRPRSPYLLMVPIVIALIVLHLMEAGVFAACYGIIGAAASAEQALVHSISIYAMSDQPTDLPAGWTLLPPLQALQGLLMFAWSVVFLLRVSARREA